MSRSYRKEPVIGWACKPRDSEKHNKQEWHRRMRAAVRHALHHADPDTVLLPHERAVSNVWCFYKDGKYRFDPREHPKLMRK